MLEFVISKSGKDLITLPLDGDAVRIGRAGTNDLSLPEPTVSRHQCQISLEGDKIRLLDHSGKGTLVDGKRVSDAELHPGSRIFFGELTATLRAGREESLATPTFTGGSTNILPAARGSEVALSLSGTVSGKPFKAKLAGNVLNVGTDPGNDIVIDDSFISAFHCRFFKKDGAWFVADLGSTNGTSVNGVQVGEARLEPGAVVSMGRSSLTVEDDSDNKMKSFFGLVSEDPSMRPVFDAIRRASPSDETILITGESGSGKELVAHACHKLSRRKGQPIVALNCAAITRDLIESELFGHEKGAFTGAQIKRKGLFEEADKGTLFLDEIGELAMDVQAKLLRALESGEIRRVGSNVPVHVDTRVVAATHRSLPERVRKGEFREDLYYRICVIEIPLPPLRKRPADIPLLAEHFLARATRSTVPKRLSNEAIERLREYRFPGNVRELKHIVTRAAIMCPETTIEADQLIFAPPTLADRVAESQIYHKGKTLKEVEIEALRQALAANDGNQKAAARVLGIARSTLINKMEKYQISAREQN
jgi:DNA-binding NtrC family response regulator